MTDLAARPAAGGDEAGGNEADDLIATMGPLSWRGHLAFALLGLGIGLGLVAYILQLRKGLIVTAMTDYFSWGVYIINFVFFIGISMAGTLISAMLRLTGAHWRAPITRIAEGITLFSLMIAGPMIIVDMGRPDRFWHVMVFGRVQSPILWDVLSLTTYMTGSLLYLYLPMIPDMAILRDRGAQFPAWRRAMYSVLAMGWRGTAEQFHRLEKAISVMAVIIIPVAVSIHTVTSWIFGMTLRPGWHTSIIGPDFVVGALYSGIAAVITAIALFRHFLKLQNYITADHFRKLGLLLLTFGFAYAYFVVNEYMGAGYTGAGEEKHLLHAIFAGPYAVEFWSMMLFGLVVPIILLAMPWTRRVGWIVTASVFVNIGMWLKRYIIVVPTLSTTFLPPPMDPHQPAKLAMYVPTWVEWAITIGGFSVFILLYMLFARLFPIVSIWEVRSEHAAANKPA